MCEGMMSMELRAKGQIIYHSRWVVLECPKDIVDYYHYWVERKTGVRLHKPKFGSHVSVIRGTEEFNRENHHYRKYHEGYVEFLYTNDLETNGDYWWLPVQCQTLENLRSELGLEKELPFGFHLTIGREKQK